MRGGLCPPLTYNHRSRPTERGQSHVATGAELVQRWQHVLIEVKSFEQCTAKKEEEKKVTSVQDKHQGKVDILQEVKDGQQERG